MDAAKGDGTRQPRRLALSEKELLRSLAAELTHSGRDALDALNEAVSAISEMRKQIDGSGEASELRADEEGDAMVLSDQEFLAATARGEELLRKGYAVRAAYDAAQKRLVVDLHTGVTIMVPVRLIEDLAEAAEEDLEEVEITAVGLGLHWPRLDADLYVPGLMQGIYGTKRWMAAQQMAAPRRDSQATRQP